MVRNYLHTKDKPRTLLRRNVCTSCGCLLLICIPSYPARGARWGEMTIFELLFFWTILFIIVKSNHRLSNNDSDVRFICWLQKLVFYSSSILKKCTAKLVIRYVNHISVFATVSSPASRLLGRIWVWSLYNGIKREAKGKVCVHLFIRAFVEKSTF